MSFLLRSISKKRKYNLQTSFIRSVRNIQSNKSLGKVDVVIASTFGIGYEIGENLAKNGANVVVSSRKENHVDDT